MDTARRWYVYTVAGIGLAALATGIVVLLSALVVELRLGHGTELTAGGLMRDQVSRAIALIAVGLPVWLIHWWFAQRGLQDGDARSAQERRSAVRALYITVVRLACLIVALGAALRIVETAVGLPSGAPHMSVGRAMEALVPLGVASVIWAYHARLSGRDLRRAGTQGAAAWLPRLYRYGGASIALAITIIGASSITATTLGLVIGAEDVGSSGTWWRRALAVALSQVAVGLAAWWLHWREADSLIADATSVGEDERTTRLRATYFGGVLLIAAAVVSSVVAASMIELIRRLSGAVDGSDLRDLLEAVVGPPLTVVPLVVAAWLHGRHRSRELLPVGDRAVDDWRRVAAHVVALVGLWVLAGGAVRLLWLALDGAAGASVMAGPGSLIDPLAMGLALVVTGACAWLPAWRSVLRRRTDDPAREAAAPAANIYLYLVTGIGLVALTLGSAFVVYRAVDSALGGLSVGPLIAALSVPLATIGVAAAVVAYHGHLILLDRRIAAPGEASTPIVSGA